MSMGRTPPVVITQTQPDSPTKAVIVQNQKLKKTGAQTLGGLTLYGFLYLHSQGPISKRYRPKAKKNMYDVGFFSGGNVSTD